MSDAGVLRILMYALGGEGGTTVAKWIVDAARHDGHRAQGTSIPGVAQRTGATTYYIEIVPAGGPRADEPVLALSPNPGMVDVVLATELVEAGRAMQAGYVSPERTTLVMSSHRIYSIAEKTAMADARYPPDRIAGAATALSRQLVSFDMAALARRHKVPVTVVLLGAAASTMPIGRSAFEHVISASRKDATASLRGFAAGYEAAGSAGASPTALAAGDPSAAASTPADRAVETFPAPVRHLLALGVERLADYQDEAYGRLYLSRIRAIADLDAEHGGEDDGYALTAAAVRYAALWMGYEDIIRVADLKTRPERLAQVRRESGAQPGQPVRIYEFLKPGVEELCALLPPRLAARVRRYVQRHPRAARLGFQVRLRTNAIPGYVLLRGLASLRPLRRFTSRWHEEQHAIEDWLAVIRDAVPLDRRLAVEIAQCGRLIKGYGSTHQRGRQNFQRLLALAAGGIRNGESADALGEVLRQARGAALSDPEGQAMDLLLATYQRGEPMPQPKRPAIMMKVASHA